MAASPSHKFGQNLGNLLEYLVLDIILKPRLQDFANQKNYFLDSKGDRSARKGKKVTWEDKYENSHDLDFVIEAGGSDTLIGRPVAFIEAAWRRYTKHSKNKAQEIQGAILPIIELHQLDAPFYGAILAGDFTDPALNQLRRNGFSILYIPYKDVIEAFAAAGLNIAFDEETSDEVFAQANRDLAEVYSDKNKINQLCNALASKLRSDIDVFMDSLRLSLERYVTQVVLIPLFGMKAIWSSVYDAIVHLRSFDSKKMVGIFQKVEIIVDYSNGSTIRASFIDIKEAEIFLTKNATQFELSSL